MLFNLPAWFETLVGIFIIFYKWLNTFCIPCHSFIAFNIQVVHNIDFFSFFFTVVKYCSAILKLPLEAELNLMMQSDTQKKQALKIGQLPN